MRYIVGEMVAGRPCCKRPNPWMNWCRWRVASDEVLKVAPMHLGICVECGSIVARSAHNQWGTVTAKGIWILSFVRRRLYRELIAERREILLASTTVTLTPDQCARFAIHMAARGGPESLAAGRHLSAPPPEMDATLARTHSGSPPAATRSPAAKLFRQLLAAVFRRLTHLTRARPARRTRTHDARTGRAGRAA